MTQSPRTPEESLGFIGLGTMGQPMAHNLLQADYPVTVCPHTNRAPADALAAAGATVVATPREVAAAATIVITMVPDSPQVEEVVRGPDGVLAGARPGSVLIDMCSIAPAATRRIGAALAERDIAMLDAPVSGGPARAADGTLTIMVGGEAAVLERCRPILDILGGQITHVGPLGSGEMLKAVNQLMIGTIMLANAEGLALGLKAGLPLETMRQVIGTASGGNYLLNQWLPKIAFTGSYEGGFALDLLLKDLRIALSAAEELGVPTLGSALVYQLFRLMQQQGHGREDYSVLLHWWEETAGVSFGPQMRDA
jgi:3-hydroxyisobutyrate dehydrogenase-like beta-hydroxyacid dehydrogenase